MTHIPSVGLLIQELRGDVAELRSEVNIKGTLLEIKGMLSDIKELIKSDMTPEEVSQVAGMIHTASQKLDRTAKNPLST